MRGIASGVTALPAALANDIAEFCSREPTPLTIEQILTMREPSEASRMLMDELPVRLANRIAHLEALSNLDELEQMLSVRADFVRSFASVRKAHKQEATPEEFARVLSEIKSRHSTITNSVSIGMRQWKELQIARGMPQREARRHVDEFLDRLFLSKIGVETLTSQYLAIFNKGSGVVDPRCDPMEICQRAADRVTKMAKTHLKRPPKIILKRYGIEEARTAPLIPAYLFYIVAELLKNSVRAVGELHESKYGLDEPPPVTVRISSDLNQVGVQIFDMGGGIPFERQPHIWSYNYTTAKGSKLCNQTGQILEKATQPTALAGFGVGLPLSRLYAEYIGGSVHVMSMPHFGTHAYIFLQRSGKRGEALPIFVNWQRKRRLKEELVKLEALKKEAVELEEYFEAGRLKVQIGEVRAELSTLIQ